MTSVPPERLRPGVGRPIEWFYPTRGRQVLLRTYASRISSRHADGPPMEGVQVLFWSGDRREPPHVHIKKGAAEAKVWLDPVRLATAVDLKGHEVNEVLRKVQEQERVFVRAWHDHFGS